MSDEPKAAPSQEVVDQVYGDVASGNFAFTVKAAPSQEPVAYYEPDSCGLVLATAWDGDGVVFPYEGSWCPLYMHPAPSQEPVAWMYEDNMGRTVTSILKPGNWRTHTHQPLYTHPSDAAAQIAEAKSEAFQERLLRVGEIKRKDEQIAQLQADRDDMAKAYGLLNAELKSEKAAHEAWEQEHLKEVAELTAAARDALNAYEHIKTTGIHPSVCADVQRAFAALRDALGEK